jgi:hypothetical protein
VRFRWRDDQRTDHHSPPDIWTEMKELRDIVHNLGTIVVEQREK